MTPEQIATDREMELTAVKAGLMQCSSVYRKDCGREDTDEEELNFSNDDLRAVNEVILQTALYGEDPHLKFKAATYIRDDKKGRKEIVKQMGSQIFNILQFNEELRAMKDSAKAAKDRILRNSPIEA